MCRKKFVYVHKVKQILFCFGTDKGSLLRKKHHKPPPHPHLCFLRYADKKGKKVAIKYKQLIRQHITLDHIRSVHGPGPSGCVQDWQS